MEVKYVEVFNQDVYFNQNCTATGDPIYFTIEPGKKYRVSINGMTEDTMGRSLTIEGMTAVWFGNGSIYSAEVFEDTGETFYGDNMVYDDGRLNFCSLAVCDKTVPVVIYEIIEIPTAPTIDPNYLTDLFINEVKPALERHSGSGGSTPDSPGDVFILVDEAGNEATAVYVEEATVFDATANDIRAGKIAATESGVTVGTLEV